MNVSHPVRLGALLVRIALINSLTLGKIVRRWLFYMLALLFLGGVMVVLLFIVSVCANEKFFFQPVDFKPALLLGLRLIVIIPFSTKQERFSQINRALTVYQRANSFNFLIMVFRLILCIIRVVKISKLEAGPLVKRL